MLKMRNGNGYDYLITIRVKMISTLTKNIAKVFSPFPSRMLIHHLPS